MKILIIGASSYVGARMFFDLRNKFELIGTYQSNQLSPKFIPMDITRPRDIDRTFQKYKPNIIIHAAANSKPKWCQENPLLAKSLNQDATKNIVTSANKIGARLIYISSFAAINPTNIYGETKQKSEEHVKQTNAGFAILRPSLVIGMSPNTTNKHSFNRLLNNLEQKIVDKYDTSWKFQPTYIGHLSEITEHIINRNIINEVIPVAVKQRKSRYELARDILNNFGVEADQINNHEEDLLAVDSLKQLRTLNMPIYSYKEIITKIVEEINTREKFFTPL